jgi:hypothetical protein
MNYLKWNDEFCAKQIREIPELFADKLQGLNISKLTEEEMKDLGFGVWDEDNPMRLIPLWLLKFLPDQIETESIGGEKKILEKSTMDNDHRFGCLAYGIIPALNKETDEETKPN